MLIVYVLLGLLAIVAAILFGMWLAGKKKSRLQRMDVDADSEIAADAFAAFHRRQAEELVRNSGVRLKCMNCDNVFDGPMPDTGCPNCHVASLVIAADRAPKSGAPTPTNSAIRPGLPPLLDEVSLSRPEPRQDLQDPPD
jgi:hypothetical protein